MNDVIELCEECSKILYRSFNCKIKSLLFFPKKNNNSVRVSEQEARFAFVEALFKKNYGYKYCIETPTKKAYKFSDGKPRQDDAGQSALIDLSLSKNKELIHIEFKEGNPREDAITKDIVKLCHEDVEKAVWFHLLKNSDLGTLRSIFDKFISAFHHIDKFKKKEIYFHIYILEKELSFSKKLNLQEYREDFFDFTYDKIEKDGNGWKSIKIEEKQEF